MARNRMLKPEFWEDYKFAECSSNARLLFLAMLNFADDEGFLEHNCRWLKVKCLPYDSVKIDPLLDELLKIDRIESNNGVIWIKNFLKHQRIDRPNRSSLSQIFNDSMNDRRMIDEQSPPKDKIKEDKLKKDKESKSAYGEFKNVFLLKEELEKLIQRFGEDLTKEKIEAISSYVASKGKKYSSHYATILMWAKKDSPKKLENQRAASQDFDITTINLKPQKR